VGKRRIVSRMKNRTSLPHITMLATVIENLKKPGPSHLGKRNLRLHLNELTNPSQFNIQPVTNIHKFFKV